MFTPQDFVTCISDNLRKRSFGHKRIKEITDDFQQRADAYQQQGMNATDASSTAMKDIFDAISLNTQERLKRTAKMVAAQSENINRVQQGLTVSTSRFLLDGKRGSQGVALARAAVSLIEHDPRFKGSSYETNKDVTRGQLYAVFGSTLETIGKGAFGRQKGKAHLPNVIREVFGDNTGDKAAKDFAAAWLKVSDLGVDLFNQAGGSLRKLDRYLPQGQNSVKLAKAGEARWVEAHMDAVDWNRTRWPDGGIVPPEQRAAVLSKVYNTIATDGASKIDVSKFRGKGKAVGNQLDQHRFLHYKNADAWLKVHDEFGDGNVFDVFVRHIESMSHDIARVETFGPNPEMTALNVTAIVRREASKLSVRDQADAEAVLKNKFEPMFETIMHQNPMDPNSTMGNLVTGISNILTAAQLGSAAVLAMPGDLMQTIAVRQLNNMGLFDGAGYYVKALLTDPKGMMEIATQSGLIMDQVVMSTYAQTRFTGLATRGPAVTRHISEAIMRASMLAGHTRAARWATQAEFMGLLQRSRQTSFAELPFRRVMERYGITAEDWDAFRNGVKPWTPKQGVNFLRPIDILETNMGNKQALYRKFQGMLFDESKTMVPESTVEGAVALKNTTRPDTLVGSILYSFAMYKNFPISFAMIYGRLGMTTRTKTGRLGFYAGLGAGMTMVGAVGTQIREISKGRDPLPMDNAAFFGKAMLAGGALSIYGDFLFEGINEYGRGPEGAVAGPLVGFLGDTTNLVLGDAFQWAETVGSLSDKEFKSNTATRAVEWAKRYTPGTSVWWARAALERQMWDRLQEIADPKAYRKRANTMRKREREYGQGYWWAPGTGLPNGRPNTESKIWRSLPKS